MQNRIELHGDGGGSPYTFKIKSALRYRRLNFDFMRLGPGGMDQDTWE